MKPSFPFSVSNPVGLSLQINSNGSIRRMECGDININLFPGNEAEGGPINIHLRQLSETVESIPLLGPSSPATWHFDDRGMTGQGQWRNIAFRIRLILSKEANTWFWHVELNNTGTESARYDLIHTQDIGIAHYSAIRLNEYYVSQYIDHSPLFHPAKGVAIASRQNLSMGGRYPWTIIGSLGSAVSYATDALQFHALSSRAGTVSVALSKGLPGARLQHEHSMVCIQDEAIDLNPGQKSTRGFFTWFEDYHPDATSDSDLAKIDTVLALPEATCPSWPEDVPDSSSAPSLFATAPWLETRDLTKNETRGFFDDNPQHEETGHGKCLSFFTHDGTHVVLKAKELEVLRPHGHILRSGSALVIDEASLTSTTWMSGVFHSMVTQGHVSINRFLSTCHTYLGLFLSHGQRIFVEIDGEWRLLGIPSAFSMKADVCRWIYQHAGGTIEVTSTASETDHELGLSLKVLSGPPLRFLISHHIAMNGDDGLRPGKAVWETVDNAVHVRAVTDSDVGRRFPDGCFVIEPDTLTTIEEIGGDELLYPDKLSHNEPFVCLLTAPSTSAVLTIRGKLVTSQAPQSPGFWQSISNTLSITTAGSGTSALAAQRIAKIFPWFIQNSLVHYLSPRGLEQYSGGGWGTRDICQGPLELLLSLGHFDPVRDLLCRVFQQQNPDGDWPQWFMLFERDHNIRAGDSHGDIVYWPILALAQYLEITGDTSLLEERLSFFQHDGNGETTTLLAHVDRALDLIRRRVIPGTVLAAYGHGDWNDSLQPAKPEMRKQLCSSWTVTLNYQTFMTLADALRKVGHIERATSLETEAAGILEAFQRILIVDEIIAGLVYFHPEAEAEALLHPRDSSTGLSYSLLPMIHAIINDMFTPEQAAKHLDLIRNHLIGPDGAHLFDKPIAYHGGIQKNFQRAESASYFGREIGNMYTHAHIRYAEALAHHGNAAEFFHALCQINPIAIRELIPCAAPRQANCYYSSTDPSFSDRYQALAEYEKSLVGDVPLEGGWRVYSSGPGLTVRLIMHCFLGLRVATDSLVIDPCIPPELDGLTARVNLGGRDIEIIYHIEKTGHSPQSVELNGTALSFSHLTNRYRAAGLLIPIESWNTHLKESANRLVITLE
jgi:cellobiose phosphorylase